MHEKHRLDDLLKQHNEKFLVRLNRILDHPGHQDDLLQETMLQVSASFPSYQEGRCFLAWITGIATNTYRMMKRKHVFSQKTCRAYYDIKLLSVHALFSEGDPAQQAITKEEYQKAHEIWCSMPVEYREFFMMHEVEKLTIAEIARITDTPERTVKYRLARAREFVSAKAPKLLVAFLAIRLLHPVDGSKWNNVYARWQETMETSLPETTSTVLETATNNAAQVTETATVTAGATTTTISMMSSIFMTIALPFVWVMSIFIGGQACGVALVYDAPNAVLRRWLVKHLFCCYCAIAVTPIAFLLLGRVVGLICGWEAWGTFTFTFNLCFMLVASVYLLKVNRHYRKLWKNQNAITLSHESLNRLIHRGFIGLTVLLLIFVALFVAIGMFPAYQSSIDSGDQNIASTIVMVTLILVMGVIIVHTGMIFLFRHFLTISTDESTKYPLSATAKSLPYRLLWEILYMAVFVILTMAPALLHLCLVNTRPICAFMELIGFALCWGGVLWFNLKKPGYRWWVNILAFLVIMSVLATLRSTIYE